MSKIINELAKIEFNDEILRQLDVAGIYKSFSKNYRKLDELKNFRTEYEKQNWLIRWWHNDKLQDTQLDSAEVQAEFSKTIGQLMMISIMQSKKLSEQQMQLNDQQGKLKNQADEIALHAGKLQEQHQVLAEQSKKLESLVREYFDLKGLTEDEAQNLIEIALDVKETKDQILQEFASRTKDVEAVFTEMQSRMESISAEVDERISLSKEYAQEGILSVQRDMREALIFYEASQRAHHETAQNTLTHELEQFTQSQREFEFELQSKQTAFESLLSGLSNKQNQQLAAHSEKLCSIDSAIAGTKAELSKIVEQQKKMAECQQQVFHSLKRLRYFSAVILIVVMVLLGVMAYMMKLI